MMPALTFDTLAYSKDMQEAGFTREQADAMASANAAAFQSMVVSRRLATKDDVERLERKLDNTRRDLESQISSVKNDLELEISSVKNDLELQIGSVKHDLEIKIAESKHDILKWMVTGFITQSALLVAILAFLR